MILYAGGLHKENPVSGPKRFAVWIKSWEPDEKDVPQVCVLAAWLEASDLMMLRPHQWALVSGG